MIEWEWESLPMRSLQEGPGLLLSERGRYVCPLAAEPEDASPLLSGEAGSDMYNAKSVLMYAAETRGSEIPEAEGKKGERRVTAERQRGGKSSVVGQSRQFRRANLQKTTLHPRKRLLFNIKPRGHAPPPVTLEPEQTG